MRDPKVDKDEPGQFNVFQKVEEKGEEDKHIEVSPRWTHSTAKMVGNICHVEDLFATNREKFYKEVCKTLLSTSSGTAAQIKKVPFQIAKVAGDGKCGFRSLSLVYQIRFIYAFFHGVVAVLCIYIYICMVLLSYEPLNDLIFALRSILAAQCIEGFRSVPRTYHSHFCHSSPMHTHIHICATLPSVTTSLESQLPYKSPLLYVTTSRSRHLPKSPLHRVSLFVDNSEDCFLASFDIYIYIYIQGSLFQLSHP